MGYAARSPQDGKTGIKDEAEKKLVIVHQFMVLSRRIGVEIVPGTIVRRSRMVEAW